MTFMKSPKNWATIILRVLQVGRPNDYLYILHKKILNKCFFKQTLVEEKKKERRIYAVK